MLTPPHLPKVDKIKLIKFEIPGTVRKPETGTNAKKKLGNFIQHPYHWLHIPLEKFLTLIACKLLLFFWVNMTHGHHSSV